MSDYYVVEKKPWTEHFSRSGKSFDAYLAPGKAGRIETWFGEHHDDIKFLGREHDTKKWYVLQYYGGKIFDGPFDDWQTALIVARMGV
jgi:hypothetical protein